MRSRQLVACLKHITSSVLLVWLFADLVCTFSLGLGYGPFESVAAVGCVARCVTSVTSIFCICICICIRKIHSAARARRSTVSRTTMPHSLLLVPTHNLSLRLPVRRNPGHTRFVPLSIFCICICICICLLCPPAAAAAAAKRPQRGHRGRRREHVRLHNIPARAVGYAYGKTRECISESASTTNTRARIRAS